MREEAECIRLSEKEIEELELWWDRETEDKPRLNRGDKRKWRAWLNGKGKEYRTTVASSEEVLDALQPSNHLKRLRISDYGGCKSPSWLTNHSIEYLESIYLSNCEALEELPNFGQLMCLKKLYLDHLPRVKALGPQFHGCSLHDGFPSLKMIQVSGMDELETWDWGEQCNVFPLLEILNVFRCPNLGKFTFLDIFPVHGESTKLFPKLNDLRIKDCPKLKQAIPPEIISFMSTCGIIGAEIDGGFGGFIYRRYNNYLEMNDLKVPEVLALITLSLKNICSMKFYNCPKLSSLSWKCICQINSLKRLEFDRCNELCFSTEEKDTERTSYSQESLQELEIHECSVTGEELSYLLAHLPTIRGLTIRKCHDIGFVSLPSIIDETNRDPSEAEVKVDKDQQRSPDSLMCLEQLHIDDCPNMVFVNEGGLSGLTALKEVTISGSDNLLSSLMQNEGSNYVHTLSVEQSNVTSLKLHSFVALGKLTLWRCKDLASVEGPNSPASLKVDIQDCPQLAKTQSQIEPKFLVTVEKLSIDNIEFLSIHANSLSMSLHSLTIYRFGSQLKLWSEWTEEQEYVVIKHLTALEELTLYCCKELRSLPSMLHLHPSLKELTIRYCPKIKSLPQRGFPKTLQKLFLRDCSEELKSQCSQLKDFEYSTETEEWRYKYDVFSKRDPSAN